MKTITIPIPEWAEERHIYVHAGRELLAYMYLDGVLHCKTTRCNFCGKCCEKISCDKLKLDGKKLICGKGLEVPFSCVIGRSNLPECVEEFD